MVVYGGWGIDDNDNLVITWRWWSWESKNAIFEKKKKLMAFSWIIWLVGWIEQNQFPKKGKVRFVFDFKL